MTGDQDDDHRMELRACDAYVDDKKRHHPKETSLWPSCRPNFSTKYTLDAVNAKFQRCQWG